MASTPGYPLHSGCPVPGTEEREDASRRGRHDEASIRPPRSRDGRVAGLWFAPIANTRGFNSAAPFPGRKRWRTPGIGRWRSSCFNSAAPFPGRKR